MIGDDVSVVYSTELEKMRLMPLVGRHGKITSKGTRGMFVWFPVPYLDEQEWFIPIASIQKIKVK